MSQEGVALLYSERSSLSAVQEGSELDEARREGPTV